jgi:aminopeptidase N
MKSRKILLLLILACALIYTPVTAQVPSTITPGVSLALAIQRKTALRHVRYSLDFKIPADATIPVNGEEEITFECLDNSMPLPIDFKADPSQIKEVKVQGKNIDIDFRDEHLIIPARYLMKGIISISISFIAGNWPMNRNPDFLYTLLVPDRARTLFPCFDQPDLKAVFILNLTLPQEWKALGNAPIKDSTFAEGGNKTYLFLPSDTIPTYLFSFAAGRFFETVESPEGRVMHGYYRETDTAKIRLSLDSIFQIQVRALAFMKDYTQITFPFQKFDFVAIPDFQFGGMEHVGAIQYNASTLFLDASATREKLNARTNLLSHETAHMWFGDLVTMRWFNDVWMKEVFANFMADKIGNSLNTNPNYDLKTLTVLYPAAYSVDRTKGANPIRQQLDNLQDAGSLYGNIIYNKAPIMMRQLELLMGEIPFRNGVRDYLKKYAFGNTSWPDLIHIFEKYTKQNLETWNNVWVNKPGRPVFNYQVQMKDGKITQLNITQKGEYGSIRVWPQLFSIALVYPNEAKEIKVKMRGSHIAVPKAMGQPAPLYILFNADGLGYGVFPIDKHSISQIANLSSPVMRASAYINAYENMLNTRAINAFDLLQQNLKYINQETEELNLGVLLGQIQSIYWHFITPSTRLNLENSMEKTIWNVMQKNAQPNQKRQLFLSYADIAGSKNALNRLYEIWIHRKPPDGVKLSEDDYTNLACGLALHFYSGYEEILTEQATRIQNPDRKARFQYLKPALSASQAVRDSFFYSLGDAKNRTKESWVITALGFLHHPLRVSDSEKYLPASLDWLFDIQRTGDIFFPQNWLKASLGNYQTASAAEVVRRFLKEHPDYNPKLKEKILQASDNLFRAAVMLKK